MLESVVEDGPGVSSVRVEFQVLGVGRERMNVLVWDSLCFYWD